MSEKKKISGVRTDLSPSEFSANLSKMENTEQKKVVKSDKNFKENFGKFNYILSALGIMPMLTKSSGSRGNRGHGHVHHQPNNFRETYRVEPRPPTHEEMVKAHMAHDAYMDLVDGKADNDR